MGASINTIRDAIIHRMYVRNLLPALIHTHGIDRVEEAVTSCADFYEGMEEIGTSDVSIMVETVLEDIYGR